MPIPQDILDVPRPRSTRVKNQNNRYIVIKRSCVRVGKSNVPVDLGAVGEIVNGAFIEYPSPSLRTLQEAKEALLARRGSGSGGGSDIRRGGSAGGGRVREFVCDIKTSGNIRLVDSCGEGILQELTTHFGIDDAKFIYVVALLRSACGELRNNALKDEYDTSMASEMYPGVGLSENAVSGSLRRIGLHTSAMRSFQRARVTSLGGGGVVVVDGSLLDFNSGASIYSEFSRKATTKGSKDLSVLTAYSLETREPLCEEIYPGNMLDMTAFEDFSRRYDLNGAVVVARPVDEATDAVDPSAGLAKADNRIDVKLFDKGFSSRELIDSLRASKRHYIVALRNDLKEISEKGLDNPCEYLKEYREDTVMWKKVADEDEKGKRYLYSFKSQRMGYLQSTGYVKREDNKGRFSPDRYDAKQSTFGLIVFESDLDLTPYKTYCAYDDRWKIEIYEKLRKSIAENGSVNVHSDAAVRATEFINLVSNIMDCRLRIRMEKTGVSKKFSTKEVLRKMSHILEEKNEDGKWERRFILKNVEELSANLGVSYGNA